MRQYEEDRAKREERLAAMELTVHERSQQIQADSQRIAEALKATTDRLADTTEQAGTFQERWTRYAMFLGALAVVLAGLGYFAPNLGQQSGLVGFGILLITVVVVAIRIAPSSKGDR